MISCQGLVAVLVKNQDRFNYILFKCGCRLKLVMGINHSKRASVGKDGQQNLLCSLR